VSIGLPTTSGTGNAKWLCLDLDSDDQLPDLQQLAARLWPTRSVLFEHSRRGGHLFIFHQSVPWKQSHDFGLRLVKEAGLEGIEVYPKTERLNAVRLPGTAHPRNGNTYPIIDPTTGEVLSLEAALSRIERYELPPGEMVEAAPLSRRTDSTQEFDRLVDALNTLTIVTVYAPNRGKALCPWHEDHNPSLLIKGGRFHCARPDCVWGDEKDVIRFIRYGTRPPHH
jgi:hypothetical protein